MMNKIIKTIILMTSLQMVMTQGMIEPAPGGPDKSASLVGSTLMPTNIPQGVCFSLAVPEYEQRIRDYVGLCHNVRKKVKKDLPSSQNVEYLDNEALEESYQAAQKEIDNAKRASPDDKHIDQHLKNLLEMRVVTQRWLIYWLKKLKTEQEETNKAQAKTIEEQAETIESLNASLGAALLSLQIK